MGQVKLFSVLLLSAQLCSSFGLTILPAPTDTLVAPTTKPHLEEHHELEKSLRDNITAHPHWKVMRPYGDDGVTHIRTNIFARDIQITRINPNDTKSHELYTWTLDMTLRQKWNDKRLAFDHEKKHPEYRFFPLNAPKNIWTPDLFFPEGVKSDFHYVTAPNVLLWVYPNGDVLYSIRVTTELRCQKSINSASTTLVCPLRLASYAHTVEELDIAWDDEPAIQVRDTVYIPHYEVEKVTTEKKVSTTRIGSFATVIANFHFKPEE